MISPRRTRRPTPWRRLVLTAALLLATSAACSSLSLSDQPPASAPPIATPSAEDPNVSALQSAVLQTVRAPGVIVDSRVSLSANREAPPSWFLERTANVDPSTFDYEQVIRQRSPGVGGLPDSQIQRSEVRRVGVDVYLNGALASSLELTTPWGHMRASIPAEDDTEAPWDSAGSLGVALDPLGLREVTRLPDEAGDAVYEGVFDGSLLVDQVSQLDLLPRMVEAGADEDGKRYRVWVTPDGYLRKIQSTAFAGDEFGASGVPEAWLTWVHEFTPLDAPPTIQLPPSDMVSEVEGPAGD